MLRTLDAEIDVAGVCDYTDRAGSADLILVNIHGARIDDPEVQERIAELRDCHGATFPIAVISDLNDCELAIRAIRRYRLAGYLPTSLNGRVAAAAVHLMLAGGTFVPLGIAAVVPHFTDTGIQADPGIQPVPTDAKAAEVFRLTYRESEVLRLLQCGKPNKIIAFDLAIAESTGQGSRAEHHEEAECNKPHSGCPAASRCRYRGNDGGRIRGLDRSSRESAADPWTLGRLCRTLA